MKEYKRNDTIPERGKIIGEPKNPTRHGVVKAVGTHFEYQDGTIYYPIGTTIYALVHQEKTLYGQTMETLKSAPFNKVRFCIFPKHYDWNHNEPQLFPFEKSNGRWDTGKPCYAYWDFSNKNTTHVCVQTAEIRRSCELVTVYQKPVIIDECGYEGNLEYDWGNLSGEEMTENFWIAASRGAYCTHGETFLEHTSEEEVLWWSKGGTLKGESWKRIQFLRNVLESLPGPLTFITEGYAQYPLEEIKKVAAMPKEERPIEFQAGQYTKGLLCANEEEIRKIKENGRRNSSRYKDEVFLYYLGRRCPASLTMELPADNTYIFEVLDTWNMTRTIMEEEPIHMTEDHMANIYRISLPGKPYMAVLARKTDKK